MSKSQDPSVTGPDSTSGPADSDADPVADDGVTAVLDEVWDDLTS